MRARLTIARDFRGEPLLEAERVEVTLELGPHALEVVVDAPFHDDPVPPVPAGRCDGLWNHEVVECFLLGEHGRYVELELGPHGHFLALRLRGVRQVADDALPVRFTAQIDGPRWRGRASIARVHLPEPIVAGNAYAIHGVGERRRYLALHPVPGETPDFHRPDCFRPLPWDVA